MCTAPFDAHFTQRSRRSRHKYALRRVQLALGGGRGGRIACNSVEPLRVAGEDLTANSDRRSCLQRTIHAPLAVSDRRDARSEHVDQRTPARMRTVRVSLTGRIFSDLRLIQEV